MTSKTILYDFNNKLCAFTRIFSDFTPPNIEGNGLLSGYNFAVKDLLDVEGYTTTAGSIILANAPAASRDSAVVAKLRAAGALLVGCTNMDEFAYGFVTENVHYGTTCNPHDLTRLAGGSSGGSAAAVAAGMVDFALGSDTNGSIRIPASLCGIYGLRPTYGMVDDAGCFPFVKRLDVVGPFARNIDVLGHVFAVMADKQIADVEIDGLRIGILTGWFQHGADTDILTGIDAIAAHLGGAEYMELPMAASARSAAFILTAKEGGKRHLANLQKRPMDFDPATRDRLIAGALLPAEYVDDAEKIAAQFIAKAEKVLEEFDLLIAPSTPCVAPKIGESNMIVNGISVPARANLGLYAQPLSLTGAPILSVPLRRYGKLPLGVQLIAAKGREDLLLSVAKSLSAADIIGCDKPDYFMGISQ